MTEKNESAAGDAPNAQTILEGQLRECYGRAVYSHKTHEKCADLLLKRQSCIHVTQVILSAVTTVGLVTALIADTRWGVTITTIVSFSQLVLSAYTKDYNLGEIAQKHKQSALNIWLVREGYLSVLADLAARASSMEELRNRREQLLTQLHEAYESAPSTNSAAYRQAQTALKFNEDMTFTDREIDTFLPEELKRVQRPVGAES